MRPEDTRKLIGGYATGTLTGEERRALLEAALSDQDLFNELARDQALKDLIEDPIARRRLLDALEEKQPLAAWLRRPVTWALASALAAAAVLLVVFVRPPAAPPEPEPVLMAKLEAPREPAHTVTAPPPATPTPQKAVRADKAKGDVSAPPAMTIQAPAEELKEMQAVEVRALAVGAVSADQSVTRSSFRDAAAAASPIPYRLLRASAEGSFAQVTPTTLLGADDRVRVVFEPAQSGRLRVVSSSSVVLFDADVEGGASTTVDVPAGETRLTGTFRGAPFEIRIPRQP